MIRFKIDLKLDSTKYLGKTSSVVFINAFIIKGSVLGPPSYVSGLHPLYYYNVMVNFKFVDDSYLLVGSAHVPKP